MNIDKSRPILPISVIASQLGIHQRTFRIWDAKGILSPIRASRGRRLYSLDDLTKAKLIQQMTNSGISLPGIKLFFAMTEGRTIENLEEYFSRLSQKLNLTVNLQQNKGRKKGEKNE